VACGGVGRRMDKGEWGPGCVRYMGFERGGDGKEVVQGEGRAAPVANEAVGPGEGGKAEVATAGDDVLTSALERRCVTGASSAGRI
jgi:hypothetical protein